MHHIMGTTSLFGLGLICSTLVSGFPLDTWGWSSLVKRDGVFPDSTVAPNTTDQCNGLDVNKWNDNKAGDFVVNSAITLQPFTTGIYQTYVQAVPALANDNNQCTLEIATCDVDFDKNCPANPIVMNVLAGMANFANFFRILNDELGNTAQSVINTKDALVSTFGPLPTYKSPVTPIKSAGFALSVLSTVAGGIPGIGAVLTAGAAAAGVVGTSLSFAGGAAPVQTGAPDPQFSNAASIETSLNNIKNGVGTGLMGFVDSLLNDVPEATNYDQDMKQLPQILSGGSFAAPIAAIPMSVTDNFEAGLNSLAINQLWSQSQVAVFTFDSSDLVNSAGKMAPAVCDGDTIFKAGVKFCDASGRASVLQALPLATTLQDMSVDDILKVETYTVPGFDQLSQFKLKVGDIVTAAGNNQRITNGYQTQGPAPGDFATNIEGINPTDLTLGQTIFSNLPVCDLKQNPPPNDKVIQECASKPDEFLCIFYHKALVGCPRQQVAGKFWPYQTIDGVFDTLNS